MSVPSKKIDDSSIAVNVDQEKSRAEYDGLDAVKVDVNSGLYDGLQRSMKQRHVQMIALAGVRMRPARLHCGGLIFTSFTDAGDGTVPRLGQSYRPRRPCRSTVCYFRYRRPYKLFISLTWRRLAYMHVGTICYCMLMSLGEMMCYMPISGGCASLHPSLVVFENTSPAACRHPLCGALPRPCHGFCAWLAAVVQQCH